jgi:hypothetical protein
MTAVRITGICLITPDVRRLCHFFAGLRGAVPTPDSSGTFAALALPGDQLALSFFTEEGMERMALGIMAGAGRGAHTLEIRTATPGDLNPERLAAFFRAQGVQGARDAAAAWSPTVAASSLRGLRACPSRW